MGETEKKILDHDHENKCITTPEFNKLISENIATILKQSNLAPKADFADFVNQADFDDKQKNLKKKLFQRNMINNK